MSSSDGFQKQIISSDSSGVGNNDRGRGGGRTQKFN